VQLQNLVRWPKWFTMKDAEAILKVVNLWPAERAAEWIEAVYDNPFQIMPFLLRFMLTGGHGKKLVRADAANIEGRALAWMAGEQWKLDAFRRYDEGTGPDLYRVMAALVTGKTIEDVDEDERQWAGKVPELACGYQGGVGAFQALAKAYGVKISDAKADEVKILWRERNSRICQLWYDTEEAALEAVRAPGRVTSCGARGRETHYKVIDWMLLARLPSGRVLTYPFPAVKDRETPWGETRAQIHYWGWNSELKQWREDHTYGGKLVENNTQALCRDLLAGAMKRLRAAGFPVVLHVHDEPVAEIDASVVDDDTVKRFEAVASQPEPWAVGLPINFKGSIGDRYSK
jgi:DNA polymerase